MSRRTLVGGSEETYFKVYSYAEQVFFQMGLEFRDSTYLLSGKNSRTLKADMVFNLVLAFVDLQKDDGKKSVILLL